MANIFFNKQSIPETPTLLLKRRDLTTIGAIKASDIVYKNQFFAPNELSFRVYRYADEKQNTSWQTLDDYNVIYIPEYGEYFDAHVSLNEENGTYKTVTCTALAESELSQTKLYDIEINTDADMARPDYDEDYPTVFYREVSEQYADYPKDSAEYREYKKKKESSLLHRILEKASNYSIGDVDDNLKDLNTWYQFSISDSSILDVLTGEIAEQYQCLFTFEIQPDGTRLVHAHDLCNTCSCGYRGDFHDKCPKCGGTDFRGAYGRDTTIFVSKDNLATSAMIESNKEELKNCFRVSGGDDLMTAAIANCNPNGSNYFYNFSKEAYENMPKELSEGIESYKKTYDTYLNTKKFNLDSSHVAKYNNVVKYIMEKFPTEPYKTIQLPISGYSEISSLRYSLIDLKLYLESSMMPVPSLDGQSIEDAINALTSQNLSPIAVSNPSSVSDTVINNTIIGMAKAYVNTALYKIEIEEKDFSYKAAESKEKDGAWTGQLTLTSIENKTISAKTGKITLKVNSDIETYLKQKLDRAMAKSDNSIKDITSMEMSFADFCERITYYSINYLAKAKDSFDDCISTIISFDNSELKNTMYLNYKERSDKLDEQILYMTGLYDDTNTLYEDITNIQDSAKQSLDFEKYLVKIDKNLWKTFCSYRREDSYKNNYYASAGLNNSELLEKARQLIEAAQKELYKASNLQYKVSASLNNLLALEEFQPMKEDFECGNWIHMMVDDNIYNLRLLSYEINFDNFAAISVEFSTVEKVWSGISDITSILNSASSIAGSYSSTMRQVNNSAKAAQYVENWVQKGLDATAAKIVNNADNQDIVIDKTGLLCRQYDDINDQYDNCQCKIVNNCIAITDNSWKSVKSALGKFIYISPTTGKEETAYGILADTIVGKFITGEHLAIYSGDNSVVIDRNGITLNGGKITWTAPINSDNVITSNAVSGLNDFKNAMSGSLGITTITSDSIISPKIGGGYLYITGDKGAVEINPQLWEYAGNSGNIFNIKNRNDKNVFSVGLDGNISIRGGSEQNFIELDGSSGAIFSKTDERKALISNGSLYLSKNDTDYVLIQTTYWKSQPDVHGVGINSQPESKFITFGNMNFKTDESYITPFLLNYGLNPNGDEQDVLIYGTSKFSSTADFNSTVNFNGAAKFDNTANFNSNASFDSYTYFKNQATFNSGIYFNNGYIDASGQASFKSAEIGNLSLSGNKLESSTDTMRIKNDSCSIVLYNYALKPHSSDDSIITLGTSQTRWEQLYVAASEIVSSDRNLKNHIEGLTVKYENLFLNLAPKTYKLNHGTSGRSHIGFISQDVEAAMDKAGISDLEFAGFCKDKKTNLTHDECGNEIEETIFDENGNPVYAYSLRYEEFIALNTHMIQKLYKENETLKQRITNLEQAMA